ncbi:hypothetical protein UT300012_21320 [Paraclostridium bifermentans]
MSKCKERSLKQRLVVGAVTGVVTLSSVMPSAMPVFAEEPNDKALEKEEKQPIPDGAPVDDESKENKTEQVPPSEEVQKEEEQTNKEESKPEEIKPVENNQNTDKPNAPKTYKSLHEKLMQEDAAYASIDKAFSEGAHHGDLSNIPEAPEATTRAADKLGYNWNLSNGVPVIKNFITNNQNFSTRANSQKYIVIHDTANDSRGADAETHARYYQNNDRQVSANYTVDMDSVQYNVSASQTAHHCGDGHGKYGITNDNSIGIEMCINSDGDYAKTYNNAVLLVKKLMTTYNIPADRVVMHRDASGKNCSAALISGRYGKTWAQMKKDIGDPTGGSGGGSGITESSIHRLGVVKGLEPGETLNVRSGPTTSNGVVATLGEGTQVEMVARCSNGWYKLKLSTGGYGYASGYYIEDKGEYPTYNGPKTNSNLNMRTDADADANLIATLPEGTKIDTIYSKKKSADGAWWIKVTALGKTGWVHSAYVDGVDLDKLQNESVSSKPHAKEAVNVREKPDWSANKLVTVPAGKEFDKVISKTSNDWIRVEYQGHTGYVHRNYINSLDVNKLPLEDPVEKKPVVNYSTYLRKTPDWSAEQLELLSNGANVTVLGRWESWGKVKASSGKEGWVQQQYVENVDWANTPSIAPPVQQKPNAEVTATINLRENAEWVCNYLGVINDGERVVVQTTGHDGEWKKVYVPRLDKTGFVNEEYLSLDGSVKQGTVTANVNLRETKDWSAKQLGEIKQGSKVDVLDTSDGYWIKVKVPSLDNKVGYVSNSYLQM